MKSSASHRRVVLGLTLAGVFVAFNGCTQDPNDDLPVRSTRGGSAGSGAPDSSVTGGASGTGAGATGGSLGGTGGLAGSGGAGAVGGSSGSSGSGGTSDAGCVPHEGPPVLDPTTQPKCTLDGNPACQDARCIPSAIVPEGSRAQLAPCATADQLCVPDTFIAAGGNFIPPTCRSLADAEGRCLSTCIPQISSQATLLPQGTCAATEKCAPCFDPRNGMDTGACHQSCDKGPTEGPKSFPECCGGLGFCVPKAVVPASQQSQLGKDNCSVADDLCAPKKQVADTTAKPKACTTFTPQNREGRCLPACLPPVDARKAQLLKEDCETGELCAPCYDPVNGGLTGSCGIAGDAPTKPDPGPFKKCGAKVKGLEFLPPADGRCVPPHLVSADQASMLATSTECASAEICAPCINPLDSKPTGACPGGDGGP